MIRLLLPVLVVIIATTAFLLISGRVSPSLVSPTPGHDPVDYGSGPVRPRQAPVSAVPHAPGHQPQDYRDLGTSAEDPLVARGRYLVNHASMCVDCHTPHGAQGPLMEQHMHGGPLPFKPTIDMEWVEVAPRLAGMLVFTDAHVRSVLTTGKRPDGSMPRPPMPPYRLNEADADAIIAYLRTLR